MLTPISPPFFHLLFYLFLPGSEARLVRIRRQAVSPGRRHQHSRLWPLQHPGDCRHCRAGNWNGKRAHSADCSRCSPAQDAPLKAQVPTDRAGSTLHNGRSTSCSSRNPAAPPCTHSTHHYSSTSSRSEGAPALHA